MTNRFEALDIELPPDLGEGLARALATELKTIEGVEDSGATGPTRALDAAALSVWLQLAGTAIGAAGGLATLLTKVRELLQRRGIKGAKITFADGTVIAADELTPAQIEALIGRR